MNLRPKILPSRSIVEFPAGTGNMVVEFALRVEWREFKLEFWVGAVLELPGPAMRRMRTGECHFLSLK